MPPPTGHHTCGGRNHRRRRRLGDAAVSIQRPHGPGDRFGRRSRTRYRHGPGGRGCACPRRLWGPRRGATSPTKSPREGQRATWVRCDVTAPEQVTDAVSVALTETGRLDAVVHNATCNRSSQPHRLEEVDRPLSKEHFSVSVGGAQHCAAAAYDTLKERGGTFLVMTSPAGIEGSSTLPLYATMKGALRGFAKSLARKSATQGFTVNVVSPLAYSPAMTAAIEAEPAMEETSGATDTVGANW